MAQPAASLPSSIDQRPTLRNGWFIGIIAVVAFSTTTPVGRAAVTAGIDPVVLTVGRYVLASTLILGTISVSAPSKLKIDRRGMLIALGAGLINGGSSLTYFSALGRMNSSVAAVLVSIYPIIVLSLLALRGENFTRRNLARMALGFSGVYLLVGPGGMVDGLSIFLVLLTATGYSIQLVLVQWFLYDYAARTITVYVVIGNTLAATSFWLLRGPQWTTPSWQGWQSLSWRLLGRIWRDWQPSVPCKVLVAGRLHCLLHWKQCRLSSGRCYSSRNGSHSCNGWAACSLP